MSVASPNARSARGVAAPNSKSNLLTYMKLQAPNDPIVHEKIFEWVSLQKIPMQINPTTVVTCRLSSALLLQRLVRAFENRLSSSSDDIRRPTIPTTAINNRSTPASPTNETFATQTSSPRLTNQTRVARKLPALSVLMGRKVKVTQLVQQAVQFVGSDVLKVLQVSIHSPTVADVANACLSILSDENRIKEFYRIFSNSSGKIPSSIDESSSIFFGVFALQALQSLRAQAISAFEFSHDFELIYRVCYENEDFQVCMHELNPAVAGITPATFAPDIEARNICWKMTRLLALKYNHSNKSDPEAKDHRRNHILLSASSIVVAANIGKSLKNRETAPGSTSTQKQTIPPNVDFIAVVAAPVIDLLKFLVKNTSQNKGITPIYNDDIRSNVMATCALIDQLGMPQTVSNSNTSSTLNSSSLLAKTFSPEKHHILTQSYRNIIQTLVTETQKELKINTVNSNEGRADGATARTGIVNVLLFFPMVIGEPWGVHRDAPMITSKMLCSGGNSKPSDPLKDSVAVVMQMKPRPKLIKRKASPNMPLSTDRKKMKTVASQELPRKITKGSQDPIDLVGEFSVSPARKAPVRVRQGEIKAPIVNDSSELNEWTVSILSLSVIKPTDSLLTFLGENDRSQGNGSSCLQGVIVPALNRGVLRIRSKICKSNNVGPEMMTTKLSVGRRDGQVYVNGRVDKTIQLCASIVGFYYYSLEAIIHDQMERMDFLGSFGPLLQSGSFHRALLACCYSCILKGVGIHQKLQIDKMNENMTVQALVDTTESDPFSFLKVIEAFSRALIGTNESTQKQRKSPIVGGLPVILYKYVQKIESQLIDSLLWNTSMASEMSSQTCFALRIKTMKSLPGAWPPDTLEPLLPEEITDVEYDPSKSVEVRYKPSFGSSSEANFLSFVMRKLLKSIFFRIRAMCESLNLSDESALHTQILVAFRHLLRYYISIFNDRHVDQLLLCTTFGVCRVMKIQPAVSFGRVIDAYLSVRAEDQGDCACRMIVRHVKLASQGSGNRSKSQVAGTIVEFYNTIYIPKMQKYFLGSKSLKQATESYCQMNRTKKSLSKATNSSEGENAHENVMNPSSESTADMVAAITSKVATEVLQSTDAPRKTADMGSGDKDLILQSTTDAPTEKRNGSLTNPIRVDSTTKLVSLTSAHRCLGTNEASPVVDELNTICEKNTISDSSVLKNQAVNERTSSGTKEVSAGIEWGKACNEKSLNVSQRIIIDSSRRPNKTQSTLSMTDTSPDERQKLLNTTKTSDLQPERGTEKMQADTTGKLDDKNMRKLDLQNGNIIT